MEQVITWECLLKKISRAEKGLGDEREVGKRVKMRARRERAGGWDG